MCVNVYEFASAFLVNAPRSWVSVLLAMSPHGDHTSWAGCSSYSINSLLRKGGISAWNREPTLILLQLTWICNGDCCG